MNIAIAILLFFNLALGGDHDRDQVIEIMENYQQLNRDYLNTPFETDKQAHFEIRQKVERYAEQVFNKALPELVNIVCEEQDEELLSLYLETLVISKGSANELPSFKLAEIFICQTKTTVKLIESNEDTAHLINWLDWGFQNVTYKKEGSIEGYQNLNKIIDELKTKYLL